MLDFVKPLHPIEPNGHARLPLTGSRPPKKRKPVNDCPAPSPDASHPQKRTKSSADANPPAQPRTAPQEGKPQSTEGRTDAASSKRLIRDLDQARDTISFQFGLEILLKHDELRLIDQEIAKCQVALEQLRRCHLIPYPTNCPTPAQMLEIIEGKGPAVYRNPGDRVPQWAPPFGVVEGPYARHYAKWLIPDPKFDGIEPVRQMPFDARSRTGVDGRASRTLSDLGAYGKGRTARGMPGQRHHAISSGYPTPKDKAGPCILKRSDGQTVKLVCLDCHRENFSSTQGFINHCRIAHRRDFKSHEEAAVHCGHPIEIAENGSVIASGDDKSAGAAPGLAHPLARKEAEGVYATLLGRIKKTLDEYYGGKMPESLAPPAAAPAVPPPKDAPAKNQSKPKPSPLFVAAEETPNLSNFLQNKNIAVNLKDMVSDATKKEDLDDVSTSDDSDFESSTPKNPGSFANQGAVRVPARASMSPAVLASGARPPSSKGRSPHIGFSVPDAIPEATAPSEEDEQHNSTSGSDEDDMAMDADLSPNTLVSNNAPSLVSDDGEYSEDDATSESDDVSDSDVEAESVSDVAEINIDEDHEPHRSLRHRGATATGTAAGVRLKRDEAKHVTFVSPIKDAGTRRRVRRV